ncbi:MAG: hypothetical protein ACWGPN_11480 [Gammaproteobacteria bacterium]
MKTFRLLLATCTIAMTFTTQAQDDISGTWSGRLDAAPDTSIEIHFILARADDGYSTVLTSPDPNGIKDVPATSTSFEDGLLTIEVGELSGRYEGTYEDGQFSGNWQQQGAEIPLVLAPYVERVLTEESKNMLRGSWVGELTAPQAQVTLAIVFRFEDDDSGEFVGYLDSPDQGANGIAATDVMLNDGILEFSVPQIGATYRGTISGDTIDGIFTQLGMPLPLVVMRGEYVTKGLDLSPEVIEQLEGSWVGRVKNAAGATLPIVFRFETDDAGKMQAYLDSPEQGATGIPISEVALEQGQLSLVIPAARASFTATVSADEMQGSWAQGPQSQSVTMTRGEYEPSVVGLDLSAEAMERLAGTWRGQMGPLELSFRFESSADGTPVAFLDVPAQGVSGLPVSEVSLEGDQLTAGIAAVGATLTGTLAGDEITGQWRQGPANNALTLVRAEP